MKIESFHSSSSGNLYRVSDGPTSILIECGVPIGEIKRCLNYRLSEISGCLISHAHGDHSRAAAALASSGVDLYATAETFDTVDISGHRKHEIESGEIFTVGSFTVMAFSTHHDCPGSVGYYIASGENRLLFATDTYYIRPRFAGLTHIMVECNYSHDTISPDIDPVVRRRLYSSHFSLENVIVFLKANDLSKVEEIWLLHLSSGNSDARMFQDRVEKLTGKTVVVAEE